MGPAERTGGRLLVDQLVREGVERIFTVPGESFLPALDALRETDIDLVVCRHEGAGAFMAAGHARFTGSPGVVLASRGPGFMNALSGVHAARQDSAPLVLVIGMPPRSHRGRESFQDIEVAKALPDSFKWAETVDLLEQLPEVVSRAFSRAVNGRPGPVAIAIPEDIFFEVGATDAVPGHQRYLPEPTPEAVGRVHQQLMDAERPLIVTGGMARHPDAWEALRDYAGRFQLPVATTFRSQDAFDNSHPSYVGHLGVSTLPSLAEFLERTDYTLMVGERFDGVSTGGYRRIDHRTARHLVHVYPTSDELGDLYRPTDAVVADVPAFVACLAGVPGRPEELRWAAETRELHERYRRSLLSDAPHEGIDLGEVIREVARRMPPDTIVTNGAGLYTAWVHQFHEFRAPATQVATMSGAMGYGLPAGIAVALEAPHRRVVVWAGDGCFLMTGQELATAVDRGLRLTIFVVNNGMYGTIRNHQERHYPGRPVGTVLHNPDFVRYAQSFGAGGASVHSEDEVGPALDQAIEADGVFLVELRVAHGFGTPS